MVLMVRVGLICIVLTTALGSDDINLQLQGNVQASGLGKYLTVINKTEKMVQEIKDMLLEMANFTQSILKSMEQLVEALSNRTKDTNDISKTCGGKANDCTDLKNNNCRDGVYRLNPDGMTAFNAYCDFSTDTGGWTVIQRRQNGTTDFYRSWQDYKDGFGDVDNEYWLETMGQYHISTSPFIRSMMTNAKDSIVLFVNFTIYQEVDFSNLSQFWSYFYKSNNGLGIGGKISKGNEKIFQLTSKAQYELRIELQDWNGDKRYAVYRPFSLSNEASSYTLSIGSYSGNAGDGLSYNKGHPFSTKDKGTQTACAQTAVGAWWYDKCSYSNLNGEYLQGKFYGNNHRGVMWYAWTGFFYSLKSSVMMIRRY